MFTRKLIIPLVVGVGVLGVYMYTTHTPSSETHAQTQPPVAVQQEPKQEPKQEEAKSTPTQNQVNLDTPGPIEHYVWQHADQTDETWHNLDTGESRTIAHQSNGITEDTLFTQGMLYRMVTNNGVLDYAHKTPQPKSYTGKDSIFKGWKRPKDPDMQETTINGRPAYLFLEQMRLANDTKLVSKKTYYDTKTQLPLQSEIIDTNGAVVRKESWQYDYFQVDQIPADLFQVPPGQEFELTPDA